MNRVTVEIVTSDEDGETHTVRIVSDFPSPDITRAEVLRVFEDALRGAGYDCPSEVSER